ncbi:MAG TPA: hypothetical protein VKW04_17545 [Planctomycetota bacterium]|nr:hypothetical protein [Planctomycetota bacterium]
MQSILLALGLFAGDGVAEAGSTYRQAKDALQAERYEEAVTLLRTALQQVGEETDQLKYRDDTSRQRHEYYPYYQWGLARLYQSQQEASVFTQRDLLADAVSHLSQSRHPEASVRLDEARSKLTDVQGAIALDGSFAAAKTKIEVLGTNEQYVDAFKEHAAAAGKYKTRLKELDEVLAALKIKQTTVVQRYESQLAQRLNDLLLMDPVTRGETIAPLLNSALVPPQVTEKRGPTFQWAVRFIALWEKEAEIVKNAAALPGERVIEAADAFDAAGLEALSIQLPAGFRAARHLAQTTRLGKLRDIVNGSEDVLDTKTAEAVVRSSSEASGKGREAANREPTKEVKETLLNDVGTQERQVEDLAKAIRDGAKERERLTAPIVQAEAQLQDGDTLGNVDALYKLQGDLEQLISEAKFGTLTAGLRARALFAKAMAAATEAYLSAKADAEAMEAARVSATRAYGFDPKIDARWNGRLSEKMLKLFGKFKPQ